MDEQDAVPLHDVLAAYQRIARVLHTQALAAWLQLDLPLPQLKVVLVVADQECLHIGMVASRLGMSRAGASLLVDRLVRRGLVSRRDDPEDRRRAVIQLTAAGGELVERLYPGPRGDPCRHLPNLAARDLLAFARGLQALDTTLS